MSTFAKPSLSLAAVVLGSVAWVTGGQAATPHELTGTWSPDRQVAVAQASTRNGETHCFFRDQRTGANLGEVPAPGQAAPDTRPMLASWNFHGNWVVLLIEQQPERYAICCFERLKDGQFRRLDLTLPNPLATARRRTGKALLYQAGDLYSEVGFGPWDDEDTFPLALGKVVIASPVGGPGPHAFYLTRCKIRFQADRAEVTDVRFEGALSYVACINYELAWAGSDLRFFTSSMVPDTGAEGGGRRPQPV